jgi:tetratricopeptide (TPR) repeat protein
MKKARFSHRAALAALVLSAFWAAPFARADLPPEIQADRHMIAADKFLKADNVEAAAAEFQKVLQLRADYDEVRVPLAFYARYGLALLAAKRYIPAAEMLDAYLQGGGAAYPDAPGGLEVARGKLFCDPRSLREMTADEIIAFIRARAGGDECSNGGEAPLHLAAAAGHTEAMKILVSEGEDINARNAFGWTPLHAAAYQGASEAVWMLVVEAGADTGSRADGGWTPLHLAARRPSPATQVLIVAGGDVNARDDDGLTPLHIAALKGSAEAARFLIEGGASINSRDNDDFTPLDKAVFWHAANDAIVAVLKENGGVCAAGDC